MIESTTTVGRIALAASRLTLRDPLAVLALLSVHLLFFVMLWASVAWAFGAALADRPPPTLFDGLALALSAPDSWRRLLITWGVVGGAYWLAGALFAGALLRRLQRQPGVLRAALSHLGELLFLRTAALGITAALGTGAVVALPWVFQRTLAIPDERLQAALLLTAAAPVLLAALVCLLMLHYGQPLLLEGRPLREAIRDSLALIHRRPLGTAALYLGGWLAWLGITILGLTGLPAPLAVLLRGAVHVWSYGAALKAVQAWAGSSAKTAR